MAVIRTIIGDTGAIVSAIKGNEHDHLWASENFKRFPKPIVTCEAVISESCFLLGRSQGSQQDLLTLIVAGIIKIDFSLTAEIEPVRALMNKYSNVPMSLADACLVRMSELVKDSAIFTIDSDFHIYRRHRTGRLPLIMPDRM